MRRRLKLPQQVSRARKLGQAPHVIPFHLGPLASSSAAAAAPAPPPAAPSWWDAASTLEKVGIVGGAIATAGLLYLAFKK